MSSRTSGVEWVSATTFRPSSAAANCKPVTGVPTSWYRLATGRCPGYTGGGPMYKLILFELNEVPIRIIDYFRRQRPGSWLAQHYARLRKFETFNENEGHLSPWNTWPTFHRGVPSNKHFIAEFNQDLTEADREFPPIWKLLNASGIRAGVFGSLHSYPVPNRLEDYGFYVPDVFAASAECFPKNVELFQDFNLRLSRESARNAKDSIPYRDALRLLWNVNRLGFTSRTMLDVAGQLVQERARPWKVTRRRTYQSVISFDVFCRLLHSARPDFATFFTNHVASTQHRYWAAAFPGDYEKMKFDREWIDTYDGEILFTMSKADDMLRRLAGFVDLNPEYKLVVASSMGQEPIESEPIEHQLYVVDSEKFMRVLGLAESGSFKTLPAMVPQFNYLVAGPFVGRVIEALRSLKVNGAQVRFRVSEGGVFSIDMGQANLKGISIEVDGRAIALEETGLKNVRIQDRSSATAYHIPEGHLFAYHPSFNEQPLHRTALPVCEVAPLIMANFGLRPPAYMAHIVDRQVGAVL